MKTNRRPHWSKRKNPDKLIEELKQEIRALMRSKRRMFNREQGAFKFQFSSATHESVFDSPTGHADLLPGTKLNIKGEITEVRRDKTGTEFTMEFHRCFKSVED